MNLRNKDWADICLVLLVIVMFALGIGAAIVQACARERWRQRCEESGRSVETDHANCVTNNVCTMFDYGNGVAIPICSEVTTCPEVCR